MIKYIGGAAKTINNNNKKKHYKLNDNTNNSGGAMLYYIYTFNQTYILTDRDIKYSWYICVSSCNGAY